MKPKNMFGSTKNVPQILLRVMVVFTMVALLMTTSAVASFLAEKRIINAEPSIIQSKAEDFVLFGTGIILFIIGGFIVLPVFKTAIYIIAIWLVVRSVKRLYSFFLPKP